MKRSWSYIAFGLFVAQLVLIVMSWVLSAGMPEWGVYSMLSAEGLRFFLGGYSDMLATPLLVNLLLLSIAIGCIRNCGIINYRQSRHEKPTSVYRAKTAMQASVVFVLLYLSAILLLALAPNTIMLSATGAFFPSPFTSALIPLVSLGAILLAAIYGMLAGTITTIPALYNACLAGIRLFAPLLLFYILIAQLYHSFLYIMN